MKLAAKALYSRALAALLSASAIISAGCSDSDTINSIVPADIALPAEAYAFTNDGFLVVNIVDENTNLLLDTPTYTRHRGLTELLHIDIDIANARQSSDDFPDNRGVLAEYFVYSKLLINEETSLSEPTGKLFIFDLETQEEIELFDFEDGTVVTANGVICGLFNSSQPDLDRIKNDSYEIKQELKIFASVTTETCLDENSITTYEVLIDVDESERYTRRAYPKNNDEDEENNVDIDDNILIETEFTSFVATRKEIDSVYAERSSLAVAKNNVGDFGLLRIREVPTGANNDNAITFLRRVNDDSTELNRVWSQEFSTNIPGTDNRFNLKYHSDMESNYVLVDLADQLYALDKDDLFDTPSYSARNDSLNNPIYNWSINATESDRTNLVQMNASNIVLIDDKVLKQITLDGIETEIYNYNIDPTVIDTIEIVENEAEVVVRKTQGDKTSLRYIATFPFIETTIQGLANELITYPFSPFYDYYLLDPGSNTDARYAQIHSGGTKDLASALENSAWLRMKNYLNDKTDTRLLVASESTDGILKAPNIYVFEEFEPLGQGSLLGSFSDDIATIEEAAIISERLGMIWVKDSFEADAPLKAYYFNPVVAPWEFILVDEDSVLPAWLPEITP